MSRWYQQECKNTLSQNIICLKEAEILELLGFFVCLAKFTFVAFPFCNSKMFTIFVGSCGVAVGRLNIVKVFFSVLQWECGSFLVKGTVEITLTSCWSMRTGVSRLVYPISTRCGVIVSYYLWLGLSTTFIGIRANIDSTLSYYISSHHGVSD